MANVFQTSTGYRDPQKAMTLKALEERAKAAQAATAQSLQPTVIADPMQGVAGMMDVLGSKFSEGRADREVAAGRNELARLQAGITDYEHIDPNTLAQIGTLDPEQQKFLVERMLTIQNREDEQGFKAGESKLERDERARVEAERNALTERENALQRGSTEGIAARSQEGETTRLGSTLANQRTLETMKEGSASTLQEDQQLAATDLEAQKAKAAAELEKQKALSQSDSATGGAMQDWRERKFNDTPEQDINDPAVIKRRDAAIAAEQLKGTPTPAPGSDYLKKAEQTAAERHGKIIEAGNNARAFTADIGRLGELGKTIGTGKEAELKVALGPWAQMAGIEIDKLGEMQAYQAIADRLAPMMRPEGSGSTSNWDAAQFLRSLPSLGRDPQGNAIIQSTFEAIAQDKQNAAAIARRSLLPPGTTGALSWQQVDEEIAKLPDPFALYKEFAAKNKVDTGTGTGTSTTEDPNDPLGLR